MPSLDPTLFLIVTTVLLPFATAFVCTMLPLWLCSLPMRRLGEGAHWSERARSYWPLRMARTLARIWILIATCMLMDHASTSQETHGGMLALAAIFSLAGCGLGSRLAAAGLRLPAAARPASLRATVTWLILAPVVPLMLVLTCITWALPADGRTWLIVGLFFLTPCLLAAGGSVAILRRLGLLRPADAELEHLIRELAASRGVRVRHVLIAELAMANAFAFPWTHDIGFTPAALAVLGPDDRRGIILHELGHLEEGRATRWIRLAGMLPVMGVGLLPLAFSNGVAHLGLLGLAVCFVMIRLASRHYRKMEIAADQRARDGGNDEGAYALALEKIHAAGLIPAVLPPRHPYPSLYDRMTAAGVTPDFPRPAPPNRLAGISCGALAAILFVLLLKTLADVVFDFF